MMLPWFGTVVRGPMSCDPFAHAALPWALRNHFARTELVEAPRVVCGVGVVVCEQLAQPRAELRGAHKVVGPEYRRAAGHVL